MSHLAHVPNRTAFAPITPPAAVHRGSSRDNSPWYIRPNLAMLIPMAHATCILTRH